MTKFQRAWRSFYKNVLKKRKLRPYLEYMIDPSYRAEINRLYEITKGSTHTVFEMVPVNLLERGHKIIYHAYEAQLINNRYKPIDPIKVVAHNGKYIVVDGNHRLSAIEWRAAFEGEDKVMCEVIK